MREFVIRTTLHEELRAVPASPGARMVAFLVDHGGWWLVALSLALVMGTGVFDPLLGVLLIGLVLVGPVLDQYRFGITRGQRLTGLRLMRVNGDPPSLADYLVRETLRPLDLLPPFFLFALLGARRTLGERAAGLVLARPGPGRRS